MVKLTIDLDEQTHEKMKFLAEKDLRSLRGQIGFIIKKYSDAKFEELSAQKKLKDLGQ